MKKSLLTTVSVLSLFAFAGAIPAAAQDSKGQTVIIIKPQENTADSTAGQADETMKPAAGTTGQATESTGQAVEQTAQASGDATKKPVGTTESADQSAGEKVEQTAESAGEAVKETAESASEAAGKAVEATENAAETAGEKVEQAAEEAGQAAERAGEAAREAVKEAGEKATEETAAKEETPEPVVEGNRMVQPEGTFLSEDLIGQPVQNAEGEDLADVQSFVITPKGQITHVIVAFGGFLGLGEKEVLLPWEDFQINPEQNVFLLSMTKDEIEGLPEFKPQKEKQREEEAAQAAPSATGMGTTGTGMGTTSAPQQPAKK